jgi:hypothetical protein
MKGTPWPQAEGRRDGGLGRHRPPRDQGHRTTHAGELAEVTGTGTGVDDAHDEEQRRFEQGVGHKQGQSAERRRASAVPISTTWKPSWLTVP